MSIRKTGSATGEITGTEPAGGITRHASQDAWDGGTERDLAEENDSADSGPPPPGEA